MINILAKIIIIVLINYCNIISANNTPPKGFAPIDVVYHGTPNNDIEDLKPISEHIRDFKEEAVIFATPSIRLASCYLFRWDDSWVHQFISWQNNNKANYEVYMVISDRKRFEKLDSGGTIYLLPTSSFDFDEHQGLGIYEWISKGNITPYTKIHFYSALEAMKKFGVKVYFLNKQQFKSYLNLAGEKQEGFLTNLNN